MALKGNLSDFAFTQLLNLINLARKTGALTVEGPDQKVLACFREGKLAYSQAGQADGSLAAVLYRARKINAAQFRAIGERAAKMTDKELGLLLINANYISQQDILSNLQSHYLGILNRLFSWSDGIFRFENDLLPPEDRISVRVSLENLIIEGTRRLREQEQLQDEIPSLDVGLKFAERPGTNIRNVNLSQEEWRVVSYVNPKNTLRQIARTTKMSDVEIRRIVFSMLQAGLVELIRPEGVKPPPQIQAQISGLRTNIADADTRIRQKSLIHRLISRIRSL